MTLPCVGIGRPPTIFNSVVLPQPLMPTKATNSPAAISRLMLSSAATISPLRAANLCCTPAIVRIGLAGPVIGLSRILQADLASLQGATIADVPRDHPALEHAHREVEQCAHAHQRNDRAEHQRGVEQSRGKDDEIAEPLIRSDELADHRADQR